MNTDIEKLRRIAYAMQDVCVAEERLEWEIEHLFKATSTISDMPRGGGAARGLDNAIAEIDERKNAYREAAAAYMRELYEAEDIINGIENANMRTFVTLVYALNMPGEEVRRRLNMTEYTFKAARGAIENAESMKEVVWKEKY